MGMPFPHEYGGAGTDYLTYIMAVEELSKVDASHGVIVQTHNALCCWPIFTYGTEEQKRKYLPDLLSGKKLGAFGLTEPNAGTDAAMQQTTAKDMRRSLASERNEDLYFRRRYRGCLCRYGNDRQEQRK